MSKSATCVVSAADNTSTCCPDVRDILADIVAAHDKWVKASELGEGHSSVTERAARVEFEKLIEKARRV